MDSLTKGISPKDFNRLSDFIYDNCGIKMTLAKKTMLEARLQKRIRCLGMKLYSEYVEYLFSPQGMRDELVKMIDIVTTNKTDFFREPEHFDYLSRKLLPEWISKYGNRSGRKLMVWSAGCSSGEEPYTLAMVLSEFSDTCPGFDFRIMATDISTRVLEKACKGIYDEDRVMPVPAPMKRKYILRSKDKKSGLVRVIPDIREKINFRRLNFMDHDFGLREQLDIIFCRNVIIYFDQKTQENLLNKFYKQLTPGGHIFMGHSETLNGLDVPLVTVYPTIYRKLH